MAAFIILHQVVFLLACVALLAYISATSTAANAE